MTPIATALLAERTRRGGAPRWNQRAVAALLGVSQAQYARWENGDDEPGAKYYPAIFDFLGLDEAGAKDLVFRDRLVRAGLAADAARDWKRRASGGDPE